MALARMASIMNLFLSDNGELADVE